MTTLQDQLDKDTINLVLERHTFGNRRKATIKAGDLSEVEVGWARVTKSLVKSEELDTIRKLDTEVRDWLWSNCLPNPLYHAGVYLVPLALVEKVESYLKEKQAYRETLVEAFVTSYPAQAEKAVESLGVYYNAGDYPTTDTMRTKFGMGWRYVAETSPTQLATISQTFFEEERAKAQAQFAEAVEEVRTFLRSSLKGIVHHMADRLTDKSDGKRRVFRNTILKNLSSFLETFEIRNITNDAELATIVGELKQLTQGITPDTLRDDDMFRAALASRMTDVKATLDSMITTSSSRALSLEDA